MRVKFVIVFLIVLSQGSAQLITIFDAENKDPLSNVVVRNLHSNTYYTSNSKGEVILQNFTTADIYEFRILGYKTEQLSGTEIQGSSFTIKLTPSGITLNQIVVSATRTETVKKDIPFKLSVLSGREAMYQNPQTQADLLAFTGNVFIQKSQQGGGSPMIRGFSANRLLYSIDGVRMNTAIFRAGNLHNVISIDPFSTKTTEVLMGPGSVMYGSDAIGGVMNFSTLQANLSTSETLQISGNAVARYAYGNSEKTGHFDINLGWKKWASRTSISYNNYGDLRMGSNGPNEYNNAFYVERQNNKDIIQNNSDPNLQIPTTYKQFNLLQKVRYKANDFLNFTYTFNYSESSDIPRYDRLIMVSGAEPKSAEWYYGPQKWMMNLLDVSFSNPRLLYDKGSIKLAYQLFEESRNDRKFNSDIRNQRTEQVDAMSVNIDLNKTLASQHKLTYGFEYVYNNVNSKANTLNITTGSINNAAPRYPDSKWTSLAAYLTHHYELNKWIKILSGIRYNWFHLKSDFATDFYPLPFTTVKNTNDALTGNVGLVYAPNKGWLFRANTSTGFRAPNVDDIGKIFDSEPGSVVVPNPNLKPEFAYNGEIGISRIFNPMVEVEFTAYYSHLSNAMVRRNFTLNGHDSIIYDGELSQVQALQNAESTKIYGLELEFEARSSSGPGIWGRFNYQKGSDFLSDNTTSPSRHAPPFFGTVHCNYIKGPYMVDLYSDFSGSKTFDEMPVEERDKAHLYAIDSNGKPWSPAWYTINLRALYKINSNLSVNIALKNITDQKYRTYSSGIAAMGRSFDVTLSIKI